MSEPIRVAIVRGGIVDHIEIVGPGFTPPSGARAVPSQTANIGDTFDGVDFTPAPRDDNLEDFESRMWVIHEGACRRNYVFDVGANTKVASNLRSPTRANLMLLQFWGGKNPTAIRVWHGPDGKRTPLTGAQFVTLAEGVIAATLDSYDNADAVVADIHSPSRTIWTDEDVSAALRRGLPPIVD